MEPVTHLLTGACLSRGFRFPAKARYATLACVVAAELPDGDVIYRLGGPLLYFQHHRGWTHALWSLPLQAGLVVGLLYVWHTNRKRWRRRRSRQEPAPARWGLLYGMCLLALLSHIVLDWTNNYGVRPFAPFHPQWYAGEITFIVEPVLLLVLSMALLLPLLLSLIHSEIGVRRPRYPGRGLALAALFCMVGLWGWRYAERADALDVLAREQFASGAVLMTSADPYPINPYRWHMVAETTGRFEIGTVDTHESYFVPEMAVPKPATTLSTLAAKRSWLGRVYLDWAKFPIVTEVGTVAEVHPDLQLSPAEEALHVVRFSDLRFSYNTVGMHGTDNPPLSAEAWVNDDRQVVRMYFDGSRQRL